jgi:Histidine kinase-, DNA gyrase B-, and HSP90-like ATPase
MNPFPFPLSDGTSFPPRDGFLVKCPSFLKTLSAEPYKRLFTSLGSEERPAIDAVGFTVMPVQLENRKFFIVGVRVEGFYDQKKTKAKIGSDFNPVFPLAAFIDTLTRFRASTRPEGVDTPGAPTAAKESKEFVRFTMHEIRRLNLDVKAQAEEMTANLNRGNLNAAFLDYRAQNIFGTSSLISIRLNSYDFHVNPTALSLGDKTPLEIFKKFDKTRHCLNVECLRKRVQIRLDGQCRRSIDGYPIFELLPFVLLENAIKYSPPDQDITVSFVEEKPRLQVIVNSIGPRLKEEEHKHLFRRDFRGANAQATSDGSGAGLHFAKLVCDLHKIQITARSLQQEKLRVKEVPYSYFTVVLEM